MSRSRRASAASSIAVAAGAFCLAVASLPAAPFPGVGRAATPAEIRAWDIDVRPDFQGLPPGHGSVAHGQEIWDAKCASCHGTFAESNEVFTPLVGGTTAEDVKSGRVKSLTDPSVVRTTFMKLPSVSTLWDYVRRAMPWNAPKSLSVDEVYAVVAYLLNLADLVPADFVLSNANIAGVQARLPNRNGMTREHGLWDVRGKPDVANMACMKDCPLEDHGVSMLPPQAAGTHGNLAEQNRPIGPVRGSGNPAPAVPARVAATAAAVPELARRSGCMSCHAVDHRIVGPSFHDVAARYRSQPDAAARLSTKVRQGGAGEWGSVAMPAHGALSEDEARSLVRWILGLAV